MVTNAELFSTMINALLGCTTIYLQVDPGNSQQLGGDGGVAPQRGRVQGRHPPLVGLVDVRVVRDEVGHDRLLPGLCIGVENFGAWDSQIFCLDS